MDKENKYTQMSEDVKAYAKTQYNLGKLEVMDKSSQLLNLLLTSIVIAMLAVIIIMFAALALIHGLGALIHSMAIAYAIVAVLFLIMALIVYKKRGTLFIKRARKNISDILFNETIEDIQHKREMLEQQKENDQTILSRDVEIVKAQFSGFNLLAEVSKKAFDYIRERYFDDPIDDGEDPFGEGAQIPTNDTVEKTPSETDKPISEVSGVDKEK